MKNGLYTMRHTVPVVMVMPSGEHKDTADTLTVTFIYIYGAIDILTIVSKLDNGNVILPYDILQEMSSKMKEKAAITH